MKKLYYKSIDFYINNALILDAILICIIWLLNSKISILSFKINDKNDNIEILSDIISASLSLAGFILAALTIIAAMRANIINKPPEAARNPLELFFSSKNYKSIVNVFQGAIIELTFTFIVSYITWISKENISNITLFKVLISLTILTSISILRSLVVLFKIVNLKDTPDS